MRNCRLLKYFPRLSNLPGTFCLFRFSIAWMFLARKNAGPKIDMTMHVINPIRDENWKRDQTCKQRGVSATRCHAHVLAWVYHNATEFRPIKWENCQSNKYIMSLNTLRPWEATGMRQGCNVLFAKGLNWAGLPFLVLRDNLFVSNAFCMSLRRRSGRCVERSSWKCVWSCVNRSRRHDVDGKSHETSRTKAFRAGPASTDPSHGICSL